MDKLTQARARINGIDAQIAPLFEERMRAVEDVIAYKLENGLPVFDAAPGRTRCWKETALLFRTKHIVRIIRISSVPSCVFPSSISEASSLRAPLPIRGQRAHMLPLR